MTTRDEQLQRLFLQSAIAARNTARARAEAAEADARECRAERARYGDMMTARLTDAEAERDAAEADLARTEDLLGVAQDERDAARTERDEARSDYRLLIERVKAVMPYAINTAAWVTLLVTIGVEPEDMHFSK